MGRSGHLRAGLSLRWRGHAVPDVLLTDPRRRKLFDRFGFHPGPATIGTTPGSATPVRRCPPAGDLQGGISFVGQFQSPPAPTTHGAAELESGGFGQKPGVSPHANAGAAAVTDATISMPAIATVAKILLIIVISLPCLGSRNTHKCIRYSTGHRYNDSRSLQWDDGLTACRWR